MRTEGRDEQPDERDDQEALALADPFAAAAGAPLEHQARRRVMSPGGEERPERLAVADRETSGRGTRGRGT